MRFLPARVVSIVRIALIAVVLAPWSWSCQRPAATADGAPSQDTELLRPARADRADSDPRASARAASSDPSATPVAPPAVVAAAGASPFDPGEWACYFGNLHAHSGVSDGVRTPKEAFEYARDVAKLNFICLSEHNHMTTTQALQGVRNAAAAATNQTFVALVGQEYSTIDNGNHVNLFDLTDAVPKGFNTNYRAVYTEVVPQFVAANPDAIVFGQFNHPKRVTTDYGIARNQRFANYDGDWEAFRRDADPLVSLIAVISGPADSNAPKQGWTPPVDAHQEAESGYLQCWKQYLERGFHLSPGADQDNHRVSWGTRTTARTGVWLRGPLNRRALLEALRDGRTFATEDKNLRVLLTVDGQPMGSRMPDVGRREMAVTVGVADGDEPGSRYKVRLFREVIGDGQVSTDPVATSTTITSGQAFTFHVTHEAGVSECYYAEVDQEDSPDSAWTAPVWIERSILDESPGHTEVTPVPEGVKFVGSRRSEVYHHPHCKYVRRIAADNRVEYTQAPADKRLHLNCPVEDDRDE